MKNSFDTLKNLVSALGVNESTQITKDWERHQAALKNKMQAALDRQPALRHSKTALGKQLARVGAALREAQP